MILANYYYYLIVSPLISLCVLIVNGASNEHKKTTLRLVHVLFRHGDRTPNGPDEMYPNDPFKDEDYYPIGIAQLTTSGKRTEYSVGKFLRKQYDSFLGNTYYPNILEALSTDYNRTKASLQLVLAGLFPPNGDNSWDSDLKWQPIPYNYHNLYRDEVLMGTNCPNYLEAYESFKKTPQEQAAYMQYHDIFNYISVHSGLKVTSFLDVYNLQFGLRAEFEWGFKLPEWTRSVWPSPMTTLAVNEYYTATGTTLLRKLSTGYFFKKIIEDTKKQLEDSANTTLPRKMYLYSAHENNIAQVLILLDCFTKPHIPAYGSHLQIEVHEILETGRFGIKLYYSDGVINEPGNLLKMPACDVLCDIDTFVHLLNEYLPENIEECGFSTTPIN